MSSHGWLIVKILVTASMLFVLSRYVSFDTVVDSFVQLSATHAAVAIALILFTIPIFSVRWAKVAQLGELQLHPRRALKVTTKTYFFNQVLPASVAGDAYRTLAMIEDGHKLRMALACIGIDRMAGVAALIALALLAYPFILSTELPELAQRQDTLAPWLLCGIALAMAAGLLSYRLLSRWDRSRQWLRDLRLYTRRESWTGWLAIAVWSVLGHILIGLSVWTLAQGLALPFELSALLFAFPPAYLASMLPASVGGWGVREGVMVGALVLLGGSASDALSLSVAFGLAMLAVGLIAGTFVLVDVLRRAVRRSESTFVEPP